MLSVKDPLYKLPRCEYAKCTESVYKGKANATQIEKVLLYFLYLTTVRS